MTVKGESMEVWTADELEMVRAWLVDQARDCPWGELSGDMCKQSGDKCKRLFPLLRLKPDYGWYSCPCVQYGYSHVVNEARKLLRDNGMEV